MTIKIERSVVLLSVFASLSISAFASTMATCNANFTACSIPENVLLQLPLWESQET